MRARFAQPFKASHPINPSWEIARLLPEYLPQPRPGQKAAASGGVGRGAMMVSMRWRNLNAQFEQVGVEMRVRKKARKGGIDTGFGNRRARRGLVYATRQLVYRSSESR